MIVDLAQVEKAVGLAFRDKDLLRRALTHSSYAYEHIDERVGDNEVLEFLGDSVVGLVTADFFCATYPNLREGDLSKYKSVAASTTSLSGLALKLGLQKFLLLGKGEERSGGRKKRNILAGAFEALLGAAYLDQGYETARGLLFPMLQKSFKKSDRGEQVINNYKSALQEYCQKNNRSAPSYRTVTSVGPDHSKTFLVEVSVNRRALAKAKGPSKKNAEQKAAQKALKSLLGRRMKSLAGETFVLKK
ncbi:MAG: ribonuclease III [Candidatus Aminicenantes bacterium]|nr:ribonuclease III [Candidatus Aminicenantes bacterium]